MKVGQNGAGQSVAKIYYNYNIYHYGFLITQDAGNIRMSSKNLVLTLMVSLNGDTQVLRVILRKFRVIDNDEFEYF